MKSKSVTQISGIPGQLVGLVPVRTSGTGTLKIVGDTLQGNFNSFFDLEIKEIIIPIQNVKAVEIGEGCTWWLLVLGILTLGFFFIGIIFIVLAFVVKQRYIAILNHSCRYVGAVPPCPPSPRDWATTGSRGRIAPTRIMKMI
jgi:hypothetical protein